MYSKFIIFNISALFVFFSLYNTVYAKKNSGVRIKDISRIVGVRDNSLIGYGLVTGLSGTGDSTRSKATVQSVNNLLDKFGIHVSARQIYSRNVAAVMVATSLPPYSRTGDKLDINVTSIGDARSLLGGTLLLTNLNGPDGNTYALAQGPISIGGFKFDVNGNVVQKNHPTAGTIPAGATVEKSVSTNVVNKYGEVEIKLNEPDNTTADRISKSINRKLGKNYSKAIDAGRVVIKLNKRHKDNVVGFLTQIENLKITPDYRSKVVVNERTGTVVSGGDVSISSVSVTHGELKLIVETDYSVSQPFLVRNTSDSVSTEVIANSTLDVNEGGTTNMSFPENTTVGDLVAALYKVKVSSRDIISILLSIKRAGALHAELIIQ
ncbi:MAG: flagellar basal body P-ring protein FlgI [Gammaproteobacteria bacterium]|nr:flagellar basal body P-ring protein FlgI [Gammaproteobacteria bacterium]